MTESGGPTTQAGIDYQNKIAALYLGDLLSLDSETSARVIAVRVEAPEYVDDIVVRYAYGQRRWIQAKLTLTTDSGAWQKLWCALHAQRQAPEFSRADRLCLTMGEDSVLARDLRGCAARTTSSADAEWRARLTKPQLKLAESIDAVIGGSSYAIFQWLDVEILTSPQIQSLAVERIPPSNRAPATLLSILQAIAGEGAAKRQQFQAAPLRERLRSEHSVNLDPPKHWGLAAYLKVVSRHTIAVPGTAIGGHAARAFHWPRAVRSRREYVDFEDELSFEGDDPAAAEFDLRLFPSPQLAQCIVHAGPGFGKSALLIALAERAAREGTLVPAILPLSALSESGLDILQYLNGPLNAQFAVAIDWTRLCETGSALIMLDGLDEVPLTGRIAIIQKFERFANRFPAIPWMLTVRDLAVLPAGFEAEKLELRPLKTSEIAAFAKIVQPAIGDYEAEGLIGRVTAYPELERLVRIPLFFALLLATWKSGDPIPKRRTELIESYLKTLFRPEEHKEARRAADPELLRDAMQNLAYKLLESGAIGTSERDVRRLLATYASPAASSETLFDDVLRCGILSRPVSGRLGFPFPIVQEYLAGQELADKHSSELPKRAAQAVQRPWAQAVQFALERLPDSTQVVQDLMDAEDDAFATTTRLLAHCILNGMPCADTVRAAVGERLAKIWHRQSFRTAKRVGQLIDDGWSSPPGPAVREALLRRSVLHEGAATILSRLGDDSLTLHVLSSYLKRPNYLAHLGDFQIAVNRIPDKAFRLYLSTVRSGAYGDDVWAAAALIGRLEPSGISQQDLRQAIEDIDLPVGVRLAAIGLLGGPPTPLFWMLAREALSQERASDHWAVMRALTRMSGAATHVEALLRDASLPQEAHLGIIDHLGDAFPEETRQIQFLASLYMDTGLSPDVRARMLIRAADLGHRPAFEHLLEQFADLPTPHAARLLNALSLYPERSMGDRIVAALRARTLTPEEKVRFASSFLTGATYKYEQPTYDGGALRPVPPHPSFTDFLALLEEWWTKTHFDLADKLAMTEMAARHRLAGAGDRLRELAGDVIRTKDTRTHENPLNYRIRSAIDELARQRLYLDLPTAIHLAENSDSNAELGAIYHIGAIGTQAALEYLLERSRRDDDNYSSVFQAVESISSKLGLKVLEDDKGLRLIFVATDAIDDGTTNK
jgi:hypothetical protein